nr:carboxypeptidase-like regulatory domain-containing protein [uncultured Draconibacterium sp.]
MKRLLVTFFVISISTYNIYSQTKTIKGRVIAEDLETMPGVSIMIKDTVEVGKTDMNGYFQIDIPISEKKILFWFVGLEPTTIELVDKCDKTEVVMMYIYTYDFITLKRAEKKREKRYKKLPEIHRQAFEKGIFKTDKACYIRNFEPFYLDEN